jgi:hypothetical protein
MNYLEIEITSNFITEPEGTVISAVSPFFFPSKPLPIGESTEILPNFTSAVPANVNAT